MRASIIYLTFALGSSCLADQPWSALQASQSIQFTASYDSIEFNGLFRKFTSTIWINPQDIENSYVRSTIDVTSIDTNSHDRDQALAESDWFDFSSYPNATFSSTKISFIKNNYYRVSGVLQIRDQKKQITFPLKWQIIDNNHAHASARFKLDRRDFNIGLGDWAEDKTIGFNVSVNISIDYILN